jgi:hypothetical protein
MTLKSDDEAELERGPSPTAPACAHCGCTCQHRSPAQPRSAPGSSPSSASARRRHSPPAPSRRRSPRPSSPAPPDDSRYAEPVYPPPYPSLTFVPPRSNAKYYCVVIGYRTGVFHTWLAAQSVIRGLKKVAVWEGFGGVNGYSDAVAAYNAAVARDQVKQIPS